MDVLQAIEQRYSYRGQYTDQPVPHADLLRIVEAGLAAPSGCNKQTTSLIIVDDPAVLAKLHAVIQPPRGETAPAMICVLTQRIIAYRSYCFATQDYAAAIENMLLAITALGYRSCWFEGHVTSEDHIGRQMADILGVPQDYELMCYLPVGVAVGEGNRVSRKPTAERAWLNGFGKVLPRA